MKAWLRSFVALVRRLGTRLRGDDRKGTTVAVVRFANPGSDLGRLTLSFKAVYDAAQGNEPFDLDFAVRALIARRQVSSSGAAGDEALRRSTRAYRSRDPLYNQLKMYTELWRMLGWLRPDQSRLSFRTTPLSDYLCRGASSISDPRVAQLVEESLLSVVFPNPNTENLGVRSLRPFTALLRLMSDLGGKLTRDEMIVSLLSLSDDTAGGAIERAVDQVRAARGRSASIAALVGDLARRNSMQVNTLMNYTRFPIGAIQHPLVGWATSSRDRALYDRPVVVLELTTRGKEMAARVAALRDVREDELRPYPIDERVGFAIAAFFSMVERCGFDVTGAASEFENAERQAKRILQGLGVASVREVLYSPAQQTDADVYTRALAAA